MVDKIRTLPQAVADFVPDGTQLAIGGFTMQRHPMAFVRELIRQGRRNLVVYGHSPGIDLDMLIGAGAVKRIEIAYVGDEMFVSPGRNFRRALEQGDIQFEDYSNFGATLRLVAGAMGLPFIPTATMLGSDMLDRWGFPEADRHEDSAAAPQKLAWMDCPFTGKRVVLLPAVNPDVAVIHAQMVGDQGTVRLLGQSFADVFMAAAARRVIVTTEQVVPEDFIRRSPEQNGIPFFRVDAVVPVPYGAHPTACHGVYDYDPQHYAVYAEASRQGPEAFAAYLQEWVLAPPDHWAYLEHIGGTERLCALKADPALGYNPAVTRR